MSTCPVHLGQVCDCETNQGATMSEQDTHTVTSIPEFEDRVPYEAAPAEQSPMYTFKAGEVVVAEGDTAYSFLDTSTAEQFDSIGPIRRAAIVARLRAIADMLEGPGDW